MLLHDNSYYSFLHSFKNIYWVYTWHLLIEHYIFLLDILNLNPDDLFLKKINCIAFIFVTLKRPPMLILFLISEIGIRLFFLSASRLSGFNTIKYMRYFVKCKTQWQQVSCDYLHTSCFLLYSIGMDLLSFTIYLWWMPRNDLQLPIQKLSLVPPCIVYIYIIFPIH